MREHQIKVRDMSLDIAQAGRILTKAYIQLAALHTSW